MKCLVLARRSEASSRAPPAMASWQFGYKQRRRAWQLSLVFSTLTAAEANYSYALNTQNYQLSSEPWA